MFDRVRSADHLLFTTTTTIGRHMCIGPTQPNVYRHLERYCLECFSVALQLSASYFQKGVWAIRVNHLRLYESHRITTRLIIYVRNVELIDF